MKRVVRGTVWCVRAARERGCGVGAYDLTVAVADYRNHWSLQFLGLVPGPLSVGHPLVLGTIFIGSWAYLFIGLSGCPGLLGFFEVFWGILAFLAFLASGLILHITIFYQLHISNLPHFYLCETRKSIRHSLTPTPGKLPHISQRKISRKMVAKLY